jgi:MinD superfamily P-loop ATPase containing an inserted ferredoxin domain
MEKILIICGHYGCGKTNLALNIALEEAQGERQITLADLDIVNPYFRSSEYGKLLAEKGIRLISPVFAGTTMDTPTLPPEVFSIFSENSGRAILDAGGDDAGITALGGLHTQIEATGYEMIYVINRYRVLSQTADKAVSLLREIENASKLKATAIVNNSHLGVDTTAETISAALPFAEETSKKAELPLLYSTIPDFAVSSEKDLSENMKNIKIIQRLVRFPWENEEYT